MNTKFNKVEFIIKLFNKFIKTSNKNKDTIPNSKKLKLKQMKQIFRSIIPNIFNINFKKINLDSIPKTNFKPFIKRKNANKNIKCPVKIILQLDK